MIKFMCLRLGSRDGTVWTQWWDGVNTVMIRVPYKERNSHYMSRKALLLLFIYILAMLKTVSSKMQIGLMKANKMHFSFLIYSNNLSSTFFYILLTEHLGIIISVINQLGAQNFCFTISLFHASTKILCTKLVNCWDKCPLHVSNRLAIHHQELVTVYAAYDGHADTW